MASTLENLFGAGQRVPELDDDDFGELVDIVLEDASRRRGTPMMLTDEETFREYEQAHDAALSE